MNDTKKLQHIMVDLETLGTRADSVILSIGAVRFDLDSDAIDSETFYSSISIDSNHEAARRHVSESTLIWWMNQSPEAKLVFSEPKTTLYAGLVDFSEWIGEDTDKLQVWSNGADFDIPMLAHAFHTNGMETPWKFYNSRCFRTMKNLPKARALPRVKNPVAHNALQDALAQAKDLQAIWPLVA